MSNLLKELMDDFSPVKKEPESLAATSQEQPDQSREIKLLQDELARLNKEIEELKKRLA